MPSCPPRFVVVEGGPVTSLDRENLKAGTILYRCILPDYGTAIEDTLMTRRVHVSVTLDPTGGYPFFTIERSRLREVANSQ